MMKGSENFRGAALMAASMAFFVTNDSLVKLASDSLGLFQIMFLRGLMASALLMLIALNRKSIFPILNRSDWKVLAFRLTGEVGATLCYLTALFNIPLANATAILAALPLAVTLSAAVFMREPVGWRRYLAILVGFAGVLIIVRPGSEGFNAYSIWALAAVAFVVLRDLSTRQLSSHVSSIFVSLLTSVAITMTGGVMSMFMVWEPVGMNEFKLLAAAAMLMVFAYLTSVMTMRVGEISFVSPFRYTALIWAIGLGVLIFGDTPDSWTLLGSAIIVSMGIYTFYREKKIKKLEQSVSS
jgi:drug/metabolite transporter (DMT)-like permease